MPKHYSPAGKKKEGNAAKYITRTKAVHYLQGSLATFRKLCILKGIFPWEPKKVQGTHKTYYHMKDILFLAHDPMVEKFRDIRVHKKKVKKALTKKNKDLADRLLIRQPKYTLNRLILERYPTFIDALRDLDDCNNALPAVEGERIQVDCIHNCRRSQESHCCLSFQLLEVLFLGKVMVLHLRKRMRVSLIRVPPPHLSPFVDNEAEGYVPEYAGTIKRIQAAARSQVLPVPGLGDGGLDDPQNLLSEGVVDRAEAIEAAEKKRKLMLEKQYHEELSMELQGVPYSAALSNKNMPESNDNDEVMQGASTALDQAAKNDC